MLVYSEDVSTFAFSNQDTNLLQSYFLCLSITLNICHLLKEEASRSVVKIKQCGCFILNMKNKVSSGVVAWMIEPMYLQQSVYTSQDSSFLLTLCNLKQQSTALDAMLTV